MGKIKQLSKEVINQIAAGEIVQRIGHHNLQLNSFYSNPDTQKGLRAMSENAMLILPR